MAEPLGALKQEDLMKSWCRILGLSVVVASFDLASGQQASAPSVIEEEIVKRTSNSWNKPLNFPSRMPEVTASIVEYAPGAAGPRQTNPYTRYLYVLEGALTLQADDRKAVEFSAGSLILSGSMWLVPKNTGNVPVRLLVIDQAEAGQPNLALEK